MRLILSPTELPSNGRNMIRPPAPSFASHALQSIQKVRQGVSPVELIYMDHERWPLRPGQIPQTCSTSHISILDASFNPPTLAHLALANSLPLPQHSGATSPQTYDARMLLLSVRNADKVLKPGDATFVQRLEMMHLLSRDIPCIAAGSASESSREQISGNVAVVVIDEPTFVGKSAVLLHFLQTRLITIGSSHFPDDMTDSRDTSCSIPSPKLTFLLGFDTLIRLFSPKYYPSEHAMIQMLQKFLSQDQHDSHIVCAYRQLDSVNIDKTLEVAHEFISNDRISFVDIGAEEQTYSSSGVRAKVAARDETWKRLVTGAIANYITEKGIYSASQ